MKKNRKNSMFVESYFWETNYHFRRSIVDRFRSMVTALKQRVERLLPDQAAHDLNPATERVCIKQSLKDSE